MMPRPMTRIHGDRSDLEVAELERIHALEKPGRTPQENNVFYFLLLIIILQALSWSFWLEAFK